jgi:hypothetical protein
MSKIYSPNEALSLAMNQSDYGALSLDRDMRDD